jgi:hypothetical protein
VFRRRRDPAIPQQADPRAEQCAEEIPRRCLGLCGQPPSAVVGCMEHRRGRLCHGQSDYSRTRRWGTRGFPNRKAGITPCAHSLSNCSGPQSRSVAQLATAVIELSSQGCHY